MTGRAFPIQDRFHERRHPQDAACTQVNARTACLPINDHQRRNAQNLLMQIDAVIEHGHPDKDGLSYDGMHLRTDDGFTGHAGVVITLKPHDTGPFADRLGEGRIHVYDPALLDSIEGIPVRDAARAVVAAARHALAASSTHHDADHAARAAAEGARYALLLACEASLANGGVEYSAVVEHPWCHVPGRERQLDSWRPLRSRLPPFLNILISWDAVDVDVVIEGMRHEAVFAARADPVAALRMRAELENVLPRKSV